MPKYKSIYSGPQIDAAVGKALVPDTEVTEDSDALITSGAVAEALEDIDPTITSSTATNLSGVLFGNGSNVGAKALDTSSLSNDNNHIPSSGVVQNALSTVESSIASVESDLASIRATGTKNTTGAKIDNGTYFYLNGTLVQAIADIAVNATFTSNTNYKTVTAGALNELTNAINNAKPKTATEQITSNQYGWLSFPAGREIVNASIDIYNWLLAVWNPNGNCCVSRMYINTNGGGTISALGGNTTYTINYSYFDRE